jgi:hypothetical protein
MTSIYARAYWPHGHLKAACVAKEWSELFHDFADRARGIIDVHHAKGRRPKEREVALLEMSQFLTLNGDVSFSASIQKHEKRCTWSFGFNGGAHIDQASLMDGVSASDDLVRRLVEWARLKEHLGAIVTYNSDYFLWQNSQSLATCQQMGWSTEGVSMINNGLPAPLNAMIIDVFLNPGRMKHRKGYIEAVASEMWLGAAFWPATSADRAEVMRAAEWLLAVEVLPNDVVYLRAQDRPFTQADGREKELQDKLRRLLFPKSWNVR